MGNLPSGTVTFLFTDIEGSTRLAQQYPDSITGLLDRHHAILKAAIESHGGYIFQIIGDAFCAAFQTAYEALDAALEAQRYLVAESWLPAMVRVRMGIATGSAQTKLQEGRPPDYSGYLILARVQRVTSLAYGGQILLADASVALLRGELPTNVTLRDLGEHRLKGLLNPERLWQVIAPSLPADFPALKSLNAIPNNLPLQLTSFIGREHEIEKIKKLLERHRLVTLTGAGGTGKTRLSLQVAADVLEQFDDGAWFVELAPISEPAWIPQTVVRLLSLLAQPGREPLDVLSDYLSDKSLLLILDNCEHLVDACCRFAEAILQAAPSVSIMATSREVLNLAGEQAYRVPSLAAPDINHLPSVEQLTQFEAVHLFIERAMLVSPGFAVTNGNAPAVAQICYRLDGIPLAIELAAARVHSMPLEAIVARLDDRFRLLTGGSRTALPRHQTLRAMIDWSYALLSDPEKLLLQRLSVFRGGRTIEAAEAVCAGEGIERADTFDLMSRLVGKSLLSLDEHGRYRMLETVRQYAKQKLLETGNEDAFRQRHLEYYLSLAEQSVGETIEAIQTDWLPRMAIENDNLRAALGWSLDSGNAQTGLRLAAHLGYFWLQGDHREGRNWLEQLLARAPYKPTRERAGGLEYLALFVYNAGDYSCALRLFEESLSLFQALGDLSGIADTTFRMAWTHFAVGNYAESQSLMERSLKSYRDLGKPDQEAYVIEWMGDLARAQGDFTRARELLEQSATLQRRLGDRIRLCYVLSDLGRISIHFGELERSENLFKEAMSLHLEWVRDQASLSLPLMGLAFLANARGQPLRAVRLLGALDILHRATSYHIEGPERQDYEENLASLRDQLDPIAFDTAWTAGQAMSEEEMLAYALEDG